MDSYRVCRSKSAMWMDNKGKPESGTSGFHREFSRKLKAHKQLLYFYHAFQLFARWEAYLICYCVRLNAIGVTRFFMYVSDAGEDRRIVAKDVEAQEHVVPTVKLKDDIVRLHMDERPIGKLNVVAG